MPRTTFLTASLLLALLLAPGAAADDERPGWAHVDVTKPPLDLPVARHTNEPHDAPVFLVNVEASGRVRYADGRRIAATAWDKRAPLAQAALAPDDEAANYKALAKVGKAMRKAVVRDVGRDADGTSKMRLLLRMSRDLPWAYALWFMMKGAAPSARMGRVLFAVDGPGWPVLGHDLPRDRPASRIRAERHPVRIVFGPTPQLEKAATVTTGDTTALAPAPPPFVIDLAVKDPSALLAHALDTFAEMHHDLTVEIALAPAGQRTITIGDVLPLLATIQTAGHEVHLAAVALGRLADLEGKTEPGLFPPLRGPFLTRLPDRAPQPREERRHTAIRRALDWLVAQQAPSGGWEAARVKSGDPVHNRGLTGLALLAFLGAGHSHRGDGPYAKTVSKALQYLKARQDEEGCFAARKHQQYIYSHGAATWAVVEAYGMTRSPQLLASAQKALDFIALARNPYFAWRYGVKPGDNDTSVTAWMLMPLAAARILNEDAKVRGQAPPLRIDAAAFDGAHAWLEKMTDPDYGRIGYIQRGGAPARPQELIDRYPGDKSESLTAAGLVLRAFSGTDVARNARALKGVKLMERLPPSWNPNDGRIDMYYWYWGTLAMHQVGGRKWKRWWEAAEKAIVPNQRKDTTKLLYRGSWDPAGPWGRQGGRVYATALCCLMLETPLRYDRYRDRDRSR